MKEIILIDPKGDKKSLDKPENMDELFEQTFNDPECLHHNI